MLRHHQLFWVFCVINLCVSINLLVVHIRKHLFIHVWFQVWINQGDIILVGLRDYQDSKADVILKYTPDEARNLKTYGEFPESVRINDTVTFVEDGFDEDIEFGDEISSDDDADSVDNI